MLLTSCGGGPLDPPSGGRKFFDGIGREVRLPQNVDRSVSLAPSITEMIFAAGAGGRLVGVTTYCDHPAEARSIEKVGDTQTPNIERIVALRPQVVFVSTASQLEAFTGLLGEQGIAVYVLAVKGVSDVPAGLRTLGRIFATEDAGESAAAAFERRVAGVEASVSERERVPVFLQISREPLFTVGNGSFMADVVERAGGSLLTQHIATAYPALSKEAALAMDPPVILLSDSEDNREPNIVFRNSPAVTNGRVYRINADIISRPGPRLADALEEIAGLLHQ